MKVSELVPEVYYKESRDFSYIGRLIEILFNYNKTNADLVKVNVTTEATDSSLLDLVCMSLGFESKHNYTKKDLVYIISDFVSLCKRKGTKDSIEETLRILLNSQNIRADIKVKKDDIDKNLLHIYIPHMMTDTILLDDILEYILPVGFTYTLYSITAPSDDIKTTIVTEPENISYIRFAKDDKLGQISNDDNTSSGEVQADINRSTLTTGVITSNITEEN